MDTSREILLQKLQARLGYQFRHQELLLEALTHSSWSNEQGLSAKEGIHNERLEFLGDAVLEICVSTELFQKCPDSREGELTRQRARLVGENMLAQLAKMMDVGECLLLGKGEEGQGGRTRSALLADSLEALLGAVYLDGGFAESVALVRRIYQDYWPEQGLQPELEKNKDYKTKLQEVTQALFKALPVYIPLPAEGPEHAKVFFIRLELPAGSHSMTNFYIEATGPSLKRAGQEAARMALEHYAQNGMI